MISINSVNFGFLKADSPQLVRLGALAEHYFQDDPNTCLIKLRQFGELLAQTTAASAGLFVSPEEPQADLLRRLKFERILPGETSDLFHQLRIAGNRATHHQAGSHAEALASLKIARQLAIWFYRTFKKDQKFSPGPFAPPPDPAAASQAIHEELARLRKVLEETQTEATRTRSTADQELRARLKAEEQAAKDRADREIWEKLAQEAESARSASNHQLATQQAAASVAPPAQNIAFVTQAAHAETALEIDEQATRAIIDQQLRNRGWEVDTETLRYSLGTRPARGRNMAIAEWPTRNGPADYALFIGTRCIAVVEAKRRNKNVSGVLRQAERYSAGFRLGEGVESFGGPWGEYLVPFVFSANGRPYLKQLETQSGIWFRDARRRTNHARALTDWPTPDGLQGTFDIDVPTAEQALKEQTFDFGFPLRPYQKKAIQRVEEVLAKGERRMLLAMATGTGKTKLAIAMLYRLLAAKRFRRVCFIVDRNALGVQAAGEFKTTRIVSVRTFADIFGIKELADITPESETKVHLCTIQGLVKRVLYATEPADVPPVDQYDLMVVDECHRGYLLDREMSDAELSFRNQDDYISKYRRVLEHFDAVKIGLTATPALHTVDIFGKPVYTYPYRDAVIDGWLVDHEPPVQITTALSQSGITFGKGESVEMIDSRSGAVDLAELPDELHYNVEEFNKLVVTQAFNRVVAEELAKYIDPSLPGKTLVFAVSDAHADIVVAELKKALRDAYGEVEDAAIRKITGSVDRVGSLILSFRNDDLPKIAVTVDLLTTGIDVPRIENLVFLRRVNSRILYEQMLGRATRKCDEIGKETFRIFDAVDLYPHLQELTSMRPVVVNPTITLEQLFDELAQVSSEEHRQIVRDQILVRLRRQLKHLPQNAREQYATSAGESPEATLNRMQNEPSGNTAEWVKARPGIGRILDWTSDTKDPLWLPISHHPDEIAAVTRGYGAASRPEDFLSSFTTFVRENLDKMAALTVLVQRPRDLTRASLRELKQELDKLGYSEAALRRAWADTKNEDIAASIVGFVRQAAIGDALIPYHDRVQGAVRRILASRQWTEIQRRWLKRIGEQLEREIVVDRSALDEEPFRADGGFARLNRIFDGNMEVILGSIQEEVWRAAA
jgi:type I restriction enzyme, R subunit